MILVTGGAGFIGSHLVESLVKQGERVRVLDDLTSGRMENLAPCGDRVELVRGSVADAAVVRRAVAGVRTLFHLAACPSVARSFDEPDFAHGANATGTLNVVVEAGRAGAKRLVFAASCAAYGDAGDGPAAEERKPDPLSPYAAQKLLGEHYCRQFGAALGLKAVVLRFFNVYGPRQDPGSPYSGVISIFCRKLLRGEPVTIDGDGGQTRDFVAVADVVQALEKAATADVAPGSTYNVATGTSRSILDLYRALARSTGSRAEPRFGPARTGDIRHSAADIARIRRELGYHPAVPFEEGLARTLAWVRAAESAPAV